MHITDNIFMLNVNILIKGRVQNVGFSEYTQKYASEMYLSGKVWENYDGSVEIVVFCEGRSIMERFLEHIRVGPEISSISDIAVNIFASDPPLEESFEIL